MTEVGRVLYTAAKNALFGKTRFSPHALMTEKDFEEKAADVQVQQSKIDPSPLIMIRNIVFLRGLYNF